MVGGWWEMEGDGGKKQPSRETPARHPATPKRRSIKNINNKRKRKTMGFGTWITSGLGFVIGGPIGAVIGFIIGSMFDSSNETKEKEKTASARKRHTTRNDFLVSLLVLMAAVMKADGKVVKSELNVVKRFLLETYGEQKALDALQILKGLLKENYDPIQVARQIALNMNYSMRLQLLHLLITIAKSDNNLSVKEHLLLTNLCSALNLSQADLNSMLSINEKKNDPDRAYKILEISPSASDEEVKKAYRRMAMKYHPDKVNSLGEEMKKKATEKFRAVNEAYNEIKEKRGMN